MSYTDIDGNECDGNGRLLSYYQIKERLVEKHTGRVKWFDDDKGYGFITDNKNEHDVFVHYSSIVVEEGRRTIQVSDRVEFYIEESKRTGRPEAVMVRILEPAKEKK
jgi:CspA family cold shock protein